MNGIEVAGEFSLGDGFRLVLTNYADAAVGTSNLRCFESNGSLVWDAELPDQINGHYVSAEFEGTRLYANSYGGYRVELDPQTGQVLSRDFTK